MTVAALADAAGVSAQTIYNSVGAKAAVVKALYDVRLAGDDADVPIRDRPEMLAVRDASSAAAMVGAYAAVGRLLAERSRTAARCPAGRRGRRRAARLHRRHRRGAPPWQLPCS